jgi:hypothetical protein
MDISMRSLLTAGITAVTASAIVVAPSVAPLPPPRVEVSHTVQLVAAAQTLPLHAMTSTAATTRAAAASAAVTIPGLIEDAVTAWLNGLPLQLAAWALSIIPYGNFLVDQLYAFYSPTVYFTNSLVTNLIQPVLKDPTNPAVWVTGIAQSAYTGVNSLLNLGINEVNLVIKYATGLIPNIPIFYVGNLAAPAAAAAAVARPTSIQQLVKAALTPAERFADTDTDAAPATSTVARMHPTRPLNGSLAPTKSQLSAPSDQTDKTDSRPKAAAVGAAKAAPGATKAAGKAGKPGRTAHSGKAAK